MKYVDEYRDGNLARKLAAAIAEGLRLGGVLPVLKHIPGHGRANADSHLRLPTVDIDRATLEATDFAAFCPLKSLPPVRSPPPQVPQPPQVF